MYYEELHINVKCELHFLSRHDLWTKNTSELKQVMFWKCCQAEQ